MKPKYEPKVGDVVRLVGFGTRDGRSVRIDGLRGTVNNFANDGSLLIVDTGEVIVVIYPSQCRKIVVRERRRVWIAEEAVVRAMDHGAWEATIRNVNSSGYVEFVEARKRK
jgi:hypothetical protein